MSKINVSLDNPYGEVTIPRAKLRHPDDAATVIANPVALSGDDTNPYGVSSAAPPPPYMVKEDGGGEEEGGGRCRACCYSCRRKK